MTSEAIAKQAMHLFFAGNEDAAFVLLIPLVENGDNIAKANLGFLFSRYYKRNKFSKLKEGAQLLLEACNEGEPSACHNLAGLWLGNEPALGKDLKQAAYFYLRARDLGGPMADEGFYTQWENELYNE